MDSLARPDPVAQPPELLTLREVAALTKVSERQLRRLVQERKVPFHRFSKRCVRLNPADVLAATREEASAPLTLHQPHPRLATGANVLPANWPEAPNARGARKAARR